MSDETSINETKVHEDTLVEIKRLGGDYDAVKKNYEELRKEVKSAQDENDSKYADKTKIEKLKEAIVTRKEELDAVFVAKEAKEAEFKKRMDDFELLVKRPGGIRANEESPVSIKEVQDHFIACRATQKKDTSRFILENMDYTGEEYKEYVKNFEQYLIKGSDRDGSGITPEQIKTLSVGVQPHGGYTVTPATGAKIIQTLYETSPIRQLAAVTSISTDSIEFPTDNDEAACGWVSETGNRPETATPDMGMKKIFVHEMYAAPRATQQLLEDSAINIEQWLAGKVAEKFARTEATAFVSGDGQGKPMGFLSYADGTTPTTVEQVAMGAANALTADGFKNIKYAMKEQYHGNGTWLMNRTTVLAALLLKNGIGDYIWKNGISEDRADTIMGFPVRMAADMPIVAAGALAVALSDWSKSYQIVDRLGISVLRDPYTVVPFVKFYTRRRTGGDLRITEALKLGVISA
jgi:HK97 family phage major capsid protein